MSARQVGEWMAYYHLEPFGEERDDYRAALIACVIASANRAEGEPAPRLEDFLLKFEEPEEQTPAEMIQIAAMFAASGLGIITEG